VGNDVDSPDCRAVGAAESKAVASEEESGEGSMDEKGVENGEFVLPVVI
jgi:hypothetical protein